jgi:hypothetical protein
MTFNYSKLDNSDTLELVSSSWIGYYNTLLQLPFLETWERRSIEDAILSEKVFDI